MTKIYKSFKEHIALVLIIVFALVIFTLFSAATYSQYEIQDWKCVFFGEFGDTFGMLNTLFSAFAMAFAGYAIYYQGKELKAQKKELHLTRVEFETTRATNMLHKQIELFNASMGKAGFKSLDLEHLSNYMNKISIAVEENKSINVEPSFNTSLLQLFHEVLPLNNSVNLFNEINSGLQTKSPDINTQTSILSKIILYNIPFQYFNLAKTALRNKTAIDKIQENFWSIDPNASSCIKMLYKIGEFANTFPHPDQ